jgi:hypothetical protein
MAVIPEFWQESDHDRQQRREGERRGSFADASRKHEDFAADLAVIRRRTKDSAEAHIRRAADVAVDLAGGEMPEAAYQAAKQRYAGEVGAAAREFAAVDDLKRREREYRKLAKWQARVSHEPGPYEEGSPHSWVRDVLAFREAPTGFVVDRSGPRSDMSHDAVLRRLDCHQLDIRRALEKQDKYGREIEAMLRESERCADKHANETRGKAAIEAALERRPSRPERRAFGTDKGSEAAAPGEAAAFVSPQILLASFAANRTPYASFAGQAKQEVLPSYGLNVYAPHMTGAAEVTSQTENAAVAEKAPVAGLIKAAVVNKAGQIEVSQQYLDRAGPGISGDKFLFEQVKVQIDTAVDEYAVNQALAAAQEVTNNTATFALTEKEGVGGFLGEVRKGKNLVATTAGTRIKATHLFGPSKLINWIEAWGMSTTGPVWGPQLDDDRRAIRSEGDAYGEGYSGYLLSGLAVFSDDNLPKQGTTSNYQIVIAKPETVLLFRSAPVFYCYPQTYANTLDAALGARVYTACMPRWPEGLALLNGAFYAESKFA